MKLKKLASLLFGMGMMLCTFPVKAVNPHMKSVVEKSISESAKNRLLNRDTICTMCQGLVTSLKDKTSCEGLFNRLVRDLENRSERIDYVYMFESAMVRAYEFMIFREGNVVAGLVAHRDSLENLLHSFMEVHPNPENAIFYGNSIRVIEEMIEVVSQEISCLSGGEIRL